MNGSWKTVGSLMLGMSLVGLLGCSGCGGSGKSELTGAGSSFVDPLMGKWAEVYKTEKGIKINYQALGSGAGMKQMTEKAVDFGCTDAFMKKEQLEAAGGADKVVHIPLVMGGVVPAYNLDVEKPLRFSGEVLADIFLGKIKKWNDPALQALQEPNLTLPDQDITTVHRSDSSGTTDIFTDYLSKVSPEWKEKVGTGTTVKWRIGGGEAQSAGVAGFISKTPGSIGYVELLYAMQKNIKYGAVKNQAGKFVLASLESVSKAAEGALSNIPDDLRYSITNAPGDESYPISGTTWAVIYVNQPKEKGKQVVDFLRWVTHDGQKYTKDLRYAPLPAGLVERVEKKLESVKIEN